MILPYTCAMLAIEHAIPRDDVWLGIVRAERIGVDDLPKGFEDRLEGVITRRRGLDPAEEARRLAVRDILRNGSYKPAGRGKPANEYLLHAASQPDGAFPRINAPVDVCNMLSLDAVLPISLWDLDLAATDRYVFRLGLPGEGFAFNRGGQRIEVEDLITGYRIVDDRSEDPIVNPVKDSLATKTTPETSRVAACIYAPSRVVSRSMLASLCEEFAALLAACGSDAKAACGIVTPCSTVDV